MAAGKLTTAKAPPRSRHVLTAITDVENVASAAARNVTEGPADLFAIELDNLVVSGSANWLKLYDDATSSWTPGTTKPVFIMPVPVYAAANGGRATGFATAYCIDGYPFDEGVSTAASKENGDTATAAPDASFNVRLIHRDIGTGVRAAPSTALVSGLRTMSFGGATESLRAEIGDSDNTAQNDINSGAVTGVYRIKINAAQNPAEDVYVRCYNHASPTVGTTAAELLIPCKRGRQFTWEFPMGVAFGTALSVATVKDKGATAGNSAPTGIVDVTIDLA
jgi:hypothetical protein